MTTIRIHIKNGEDPAMSMRRVTAVMHEGLISESKHGPAYCCVSTMKDGATVVATRNPSGHSFYILPPNA